MEGRTTLVLCLCFALTFGQGNDFGMWGRWGEPSDCSRTCGGGVSHRTRKCHHGMSPGVSPGCQGEDIVYESCNTQPCPEGLESFRSVQCARFNTQQSSWIPYRGDNRLGSSNQCQLVCQESQTGRVEVLQERVVDGTECDTPISFGICLGGICQSVGCDRRIGSREREDECLVCGGSGDTCQALSESVSQDNLALGDNDIVVIPLGSTSILVREVTAFPSLVLTGHDGTVFLDSRQPPANSTVLIAAGTTLLYHTTHHLQHGTQRHEVVGRGPTNDTLVVQLRDYGREKTTIEYEYFVPRNRLLESNPNQPYSWIYGAWTSCSQECGDGYQLRAVSCIDRSSGGSVDESNCDPDRKPEARQVCNIKPCGTADNWYRWVPGHWGECSVKCGVGEQTQEMYCVESGPNGDTVYVKDELCERYGDKHPVYKRACEGDGEECPYWATTAWSECSVTCGHGTQSRQVLCQRDPRDPNSAPEVVDEAQCTQDRPDTTQACRQDPCADGSNAHGMVQVEDDRDCENSEHGCCADGISFASGPSGEGCPSSPSAFNVCLLEPERGVCSDYSIQWHFVPNDNKCRRFWYGGCQGNGNRFATEEECVAKCVRKESSEEDSSSGDCRSRVHGCCPDGVTAARGPNMEGCPRVDSSSESRCQRSRFGCCDDGVTAATGPNLAGCPGVVVVGDGDHGHGDHGGHGEHNQGDDDRDDNDNAVGGDAACRRSQYGCCADGVTMARGPRGEGCRESEEARPQKVCEQSYYGCCPNSDVAATGPNQEGCEGSSAANTDFDPAVCSEGKDRGTCTDYSVKWYYDMTETRCKRFWYGGCGGNGNVFDSEEQCKLGCIDVTGPALCRLPAVPGPCRARQPRYFYNYKVGKCQRFNYGGCKGNTNRFLTLGECQTRCHGSGADRGPPSSSSSSSSASGSGGDSHGDHGHGEHSSGAGHGDSDRGNQILPSNQVDRCAATTYGCCQDGVTPASGPRYQGCPEHCLSSRYGCCEDGVTPAQGYNREGCEDEDLVGDEGEGGSGVYTDCQESTYGCCPDRVTAASGPNQRGCRTPITARPTPTRPTTTTATTTTTTARSDVGVGGRERCTGTSDRGPCANYVVNWYYDSARQECAQFWYGGCQGNENRFDNRDECEAECIASEAPVTEDPDFVSICDMPQDPGPCRGRLPRWFYDPLDRQCRAFYWSGCQGNENNFLTVQECQQTCMGVVPTTPAPTTTTTTTTPRPYTFNPPPVSSALVMMGGDKVLEGSELRLTCRAEGPTMPTMIEWFINGKRIGREHDHLSIRSQPAPSEHSLTSELVISRARKEDTATYYCRSIPYSDVQRRTIVVSKTAYVRTTTEAPVVRPEEPDRRESNDPEVVCRMPKEPGRCRGYFPRWYYDADTRSCRQFIYGGCQGNSNNFESQQDCLDYCQREDVRTTTEAPVVRPEEPDRRESSDPEVVCRMPKETGPCRASFPRWYYDANTRSCRQFVYGGCQGNDNNFESQQDCLDYCRREDVRMTTEAPVVRPEEPDRRESIEPEVVCRMPMEPGRCRGYFPRWYYDADTRSCRQFIYGGCQGNRNNFKSQQDCLDYCQREDVRTTTQAPVVRPEEPDRRESSDPEVVCRMPKETGPCRASAPRWYYDANTQSCQQFVYGGCQGNDNNFESQQDCLDYCRREDVRTTTQAPVVRPEEPDRSESSDPEVVCRMPKETGPCRASFPRWYYDANTQSCRQFVYGGCQGNDNNFESQRDCLDYCRREDVSRPEPDRREESSDPNVVCSLPPETGNCRANMPRWYYDAQFGQCRQFVYGGCSGNSNNFETEQDCLNYCRREAPTPKPVTFAPVDSNDPNVVCQMPAQPGNCRAYMPRYHYDADQGQCVRFTYGGCGGNSNNFETEAACNDFCRAEDICRMPKVVGPCRAGITRYYYDTASAACRQFIYGGCQGNLNNFGTLEACQGKCARHGSSGMGPDARTKETCRLNPDAGTCRGYDIKWYYDSSMQRCQRFVYTGCEGNGNRFSTENECLEFCQTGVDRVFTPAPTLPSGDVCSLPRERGPCSNYEVVWYYDTEEEHCTRFYYGGCQGNGNRFANREECEERCVRRPQEPVTTPGPQPRRRACSYSRYGCCPDGITPAIDAFRTNCRDDSVVVRPSGDGNVVLASRGSMAILDCYSPGSAISWYRDGYYLVSDSRFQIYNNGTLVIQNIGDDISGHYACRITDGNNIPQVRRYELKLKDAYPPENTVPLSILRTPPTTTVGPGENAYLHCQAFGTPTPSVSWTFIGTPVFSGGRNVVFNNGTLLVSTATRQDAGTYTCTAQNGVDSPVSRDMELVIMQRLKAEIQSHTGVAMEGDTVRLRCDVSGYPTPSVTWEKNGLLVTPGSSKAYQQGNNLVVPQVGIEDAGVYTCVATNDMGTARDITYVQVKMQSHRDECINSMSKMKCRLIVTARLCGHRMFARKCCLSCRQAGLLRRK